MSVTDFKKRSKKYYFLAGNIAVLIPSLLANGILFSWGYGNFVNKEELQIKLSNQNKSIGYVLNQDVGQGDQITAAMLEEVHVTAEQECEVTSVAVESIVGKYAKSTFCGGTIITPTCVYEQEQYSTDMRIYDFDFIDISSKIKSGEYIDIRIAYPNGEDYIVVNHKQIEDVSPLQQNQSNPDCRIRLKVTEEEILRLASAYVDTGNYSDCRIYAVSYLDQFQEPGVVNYPVNSQVFELLGWNPNTVNYSSSDEEKSRRATLEYNLSAFAKSGSNVFVAEEKQAEESVDAKKFFE